MVRAYLPIALLVVSNVFMTVAWYGHLRTLRSAPLWIAVLASWGIAFFEYVLMVPANRLGYGRYTLPQLKVIQEAVTLCVFAAFASLWMRERLTLTHFWAACCLVGAVFFTFRR